MVVDPSVTSLTSSVAVASTVSAGGVEPLKNERISPVIWLTVASSAWLMEAPTSRA